MQEIIADRRPILVVSAESALLADMLRTVVPGSLTPYEELTQAIGMNVRGPGRGRLQTARKIVQREDGRVFAPVRGVGLKLLTDAEIALTGRSHLRTINRAAKRGLEKSRCVANPMVLPAETQIKFYTHLSMLGVFYQISKGHSVKRIENVMGAVPKKLEEQAVLGVFLGVRAPRHQPRPANV